METHSKRELLGLVGCASRLGIPPKWLKTKALSGEVPCLRIGNRKLLFDLSCVKAALLRMAASTEYPTQDKKGARDAD